jgi:hypothetical protein
MYLPQMSTWMAAYSPNRLFISVGLRASLSTWKYWCTLETTCYNNLTEFWKLTQIVLMLDYKQTRMSTEAHLERSITVMASVMTVPQQQPALTCILQKLEVRPPLPWFNTNLMGDRHSIIWCWGIGTIWCTAERVCKLHAEQDTLKLWKEGRGEPCKSPLSAATESFWCR